MTILFNFLVNTVICETEKFINSRFISCSNHTVIIYLTVRVEKLIYQWKMKKIESRYKHAN